ncbi:MAG: hypothetical protein Tsb0010_10050 [Parvularculaceae bacterium]
MANVTRKKRKCAKRIGRVCVVGACAGLGVIFAAQARGEPLRDLDHAEVYPAVYRFEAHPGDLDSVGDPPREYVVYFAPGTAQLTPAADRFIQEIARLARQGPGAQYGPPAPYTVRITGYVKRLFADHAEEGGMELARDRAMATADALLAAGLPQSAIGAPGVKAAGDAPDAAFSAYRQVRIEFLAGGRSRSYADAAGTAN